MTTTTDNEKYENALTSLEALKASNNALNFNPLSLKFFFATLFNNFLISK